MYCESLGAESVALAEERIGIIFCQTLVSLPRLAIYLLSVKVVNVTRCTLNRSPSIISVYFWLIRTSFSPISLNLRDISVCKKLTFNLAQRFKILYSFKYFLWFSKLIWIYLWHQYFCWYETTSTSTILCCFIFWNYIKFKLKLLVHLMYIKVQTNSDVILMNSWVLKHDTGRQNS